MADSCEAALSGRVDSMVDAVSRCGKCVEVCQATEPVQARSHASGDPRDAR